MIRKALKKDHTTLIQLWECSVTATHKFLHPEDVAEYKKLILDQYFDELDLYLFEENNMTKGFLGISETNVEMLFIHPDSMGRGLGKLLMNFAINEKKVTLVEVNEQNHGALKFYESLGFYVHGRREQDNEGKNYPILTMKLLIK